MYSKKILLALFSALVVTGAAFAAEEVNLDASASVDTAQQEQAVSTDASSDASVSTDAETSVDAAASTDTAPAVTLPEIYDSTLALVTQDAEQLRTDVTALFAQNKQKDAARAIGAALGRERSSSLVWLGAYITTVLPKAGSVDEQTAFLAQLLHGYGQTGALIVTLDGVSKARVYERGTGVTWKKVPAGGIPTDAKIERIFNGPGFIAVPFAVGEIFKLDLAGKDGGYTKVCKVMPGGVNAKGWQGGKWDREITIRGDVLY